MKRRSLLVLIFNVFFTVAAYSQTVDTLDDQMSRTIARELPGWVNRGDRPFQLVDSSAGKAAIQGEWKNGSKTLRISVTLNKTSVEADDNFGWFFTRPIMPPNEPVPGIGRRAVLVERGGAVELAFAKENMFVRLDYDFPLAEVDKRTPYHDRMRSPTSEIHALIAIAGIVDTSITRIREMGPCFNDFYNTAKTEPRSDSEKMLDAALKGNTAQLKTLLANGVGTAAADDDGYTPLHLAIRIGCEDTVKALVGAGANVNAKTLKGETALMTVSSLAQLKIMEILLQAGAVINEDDIYGRNAAFFAIPEGPDTNSPSYDEHMAALKLLKRSGVDLNHRMSLNGDSLLTYHMFSYGLRLKLIQDLIDLGVDVNGRVAEGKTILMKLISGSTPDDRNELIKLLIKNGADVELKDNRGLTVMDYVLEDQRQRARFPELQKHFAETIGLLKDAGIKQ